MSELSPAAQSIFDALCVDELNGSQQLMARAYAAAALRVISNFVRMDQPLGDTDADAGVFTAHQFLHGYIAGIADELDPQ